MTDEDAVRRLFDLTRERHGRVDLLVNNAGRGLAPTEIDAVTGLTKQLQLDGRLYGISCSQIDVGNAATAMGSGAADGAAQADGSVRPEPTMPVVDVARAVVLMADLPPGSNVSELSVLATNMPYVGRG